MMVAARSYPIRLVLAVALLASWLAVAASPARAGVANAGIPGTPSGNPLAGLPWGVYTGVHDEVFPSYRSARGGERRLLGLVAMRPRVRWFGGWYPDSEAYSIAREYIDNTTGGDRDVLSQMAVFRVHPWENEACRRLPTAAEKQSYRRWIDAFAAGIGTARVALVLQPDLPFSMCLPHHSRVALQLVAYAARLFSSLPHTTVYLDAGSADWMGVARAAWMLRMAGMRYARGFALNDTHYDSTEREIRFGAQLVGALARAHLGGRHFVVNTAANGHPFTYQQYHGPNFDNAEVCSSRSSHRCATLGIPPTWHVADRRWGLSRGARRTASRLVDAYLWIGRPWLIDQAAPFSRSRTLALARTTPF